MAMAPVLLHALLLASAAAAAAMDNNATGDGSSNNTTSRVLCNGAECEPPPGQPLPIYGYPPPAAPSLPSAPPTPPSSPGSSQMPCPPVAVVCCGGAGMAQPTGGYVPYYNASASPPALLAPVTLVGYYYVMVACIFLLWLVV